MATKSLGLPSNKLLLELPEELSYCNVSPYLGEGHPDGAIRIGDIYGFPSTKIIAEFPSEGAAQRIALILEQMGVTVSFLTP